LNKIYYITKERLQKWVKLIGVFIFAFILFKIDLTGCYLLLKEIDIQLFIIAVIINIPQVLFKALRWNGFLSKQKIDIPFLNVFKIYYSCVFIGFITPGRVGDFAKTIYLKAERRIGFSRGISSVFLDRIFDLYLLVFIGAYGIWQFGVIGDLSNVLLVLMVAVSPLFLLNKQLAKIFLSALNNFTILKKFKDSLEEKYDDFYSGLSLLAGPMLINAAFLTCLSYLVYFIQCYLLVLAMDMPINFITISLFMAISNLISFVPVSISGLGTRDVTLIYLFSLINLKPEMAVSYALLIFITVFVCNGLMGSVAWWMKPLKITAK
jgi:glycosyltransferase 2 family protein